MVDTDVFSALYTDPEGAARRGRPVGAWTSLLGGARVVISFQTRAEVLAGFRASSWGPARLDAALARLGRAPVVPADAEVVEAYADLTAACRRAGHGLQDKIHTADRWVAACAMAKRLPLLSGDGVYRGAPGLTLLT